ncbi:protein asteroid homolog 1-like [Hoplias malabaricus]|uniref:protein asteroid homolog 1-like n=1 Tax=Hoplias malabaricus TaxID=27720 RepID=UPI003462C124
MEDQKLRSFMDNSRGIWKIQKFRGCKLVIDGCNLYHTLYFTPQFDQEHGGDYDDFENEVCHFFENLRECRIEPYVVLGGGDDVGEKDFENLKKREELKIRKAQALSSGSQRNVLPILVKNVFIQVLRKLEVPYIQCFSKAYWEAALLANEWECPVLSNHAEFYTFNIKGGFLPLKSFRWNQVIEIKKDKKKCLSGKLFLAKNLCSTFRINEQLLPIFNTIWSSPDLDERILPNWAEFSSSKEETRDIDGLLRWLSQYQDPADVISALQSYVTNPDHSAAVTEALTRSLQEFSLTPSSLAEFFTSGKPKSMLPGLVQKPPKWICKSLARGKLSTMVFDVLATQRTILSSPIQDFQLHSSNLTSLPIRQVIYGLLLGTKTQGTAGAPEPEVEEYDRQWIKLTPSRVTAILPSETPKDLHLTTLREAPWNVRLQVFLDTLGASQAPDRLLVLPSLQLAVYVTSFWLKAQPKPRIEFFWALLIGLACGELSRDPSTEKDVPKKLKNLRRLSKEAPLDLEAAHAFSQWQCVLRDIICLNQLLHNPVPEPQYAWLYSGALVYGAMSELRKGTRVELLISKAPRVFQIFLGLREAVEMELDEEMRMSVREKDRPSHQVRDMLQPLEDEEDAEEEAEGRRKKKGRDFVDSMDNMTISARSRHRHRSHKGDPRSKKSELSSWD